jgi:hypothetical protein
MQKSHNTHFVLQNNSENNRGMDETRPSIRKCDAYQRRDFACSSNLSIKRKPG